MNRIKFYYFTEEKEYKFRPKQLFTTSSNTGCRARTGPTSMCISKIKYK